MQKKAVAEAGKEASFIIQSLKKASISAMETTLKSIVTRLKNNTPLMYHIAALLENDEWRGVLEESIHGIEKKDATAKSQTAQAVEPVVAKEWKLRVGVKKMYHLAKQQNVIY